MCLFSCLRCPENFPPRAPPPLTPAAPAVCPQRRGLFPRATRGPRPRRPLAPAAGAARSRCLRSAGPAGASARAQTGGRAPRSGEQWVPPPPARRRLHFSLRLSWNFLKTRHVLSTSHSVNNLQFLRDVGFANTQEMSDKRAPRNTGQAGPSGSPREVGCGAGFVGCVPGRPAPRPGRSPGSAARMRQRRVLPLRCRRPQCHSPVSSGEGV